MTMNKKKAVATEAVPARAPSKELLYGKRRTTVTSLDSRSSSSPPPIALPDDMPMRPVSREGTVLSLSMAKVGPASENDETWASGGYSSRCASAVTTRMLLVDSPSKERTIDNVENGSNA